MANSNLPVGCRTENHEGKIFGRWKVISLFRISDKGMAIWNCKCKCGTTKNVFARNLVCGESQSCGCLRKERHKTAVSLPPGKAMANYVYSYYKRSAKNRKLDFTLSYEQFMNLCSQSCKYCGIAPRCVSIKKASSGPFIHNGLDRVNNKIGYIDGNVVPCCRICNRAKSDMNIDDFNNWRKNISDVVRLESNATICY